MIRVRQISIPIEKDNETELKKKVSQKLKIKPQHITAISIHKKSIDARKKDDIHFVYELDVKVTDEVKVIHKINEIDILKTPDETYKFPKLGDKKLLNRIVVVGAGPAGLFCAYFLAQNGYKPIIIERGDEVGVRLKKVESFWQQGILDKESNVQFGEGGAGTFSDGKLNTLTKDKKGRMRKVFEIFVKYGAPEEILFSKEPHIGTDILREVIQNLRNDIIKMGGVFHYQTCLTDIIIKDNQINSIKINHKEIYPCHTLILAIGHSARDTFEMLYENNIHLEPKPFAVGIRIQHPQELISKNQYGDKYYKLLPPANYKLTYTTKDKRGVYSFCMCPGGYVVNASSEENHLAINGMSNYKRDTSNANSAIIVTVDSKDYGNHPLDGIKFQQDLERKAYLEGDANIPIQLWKDFLDNNKSTNLGSVTPICKGAYKLSNLNNILPPYVSSSIKEAMPSFARKIKNFDMSDAILAGIESRTSSPVRILRNEETYQTNIKGIYPCGEGSGYAGGITTSAIDGMKIAEIIASTYTNDDN